MKGVRIQILVDNNSISSCASEHGFALWIETENNKIIFDTGQNYTTLLTNGRSLRIDLSSADTLILSHGHFDHTGGVSEILKLIPDIDVYYHPALTSTRFSVTDDSARSIGVPEYALDSLNTHPKQHIHHITKPFKIAEKIYISGEIPRNSAFEDTGGPFYLDPEGTIADRLPDDLSIWIETPEGLVVCTGCCHSGVINTLNHITSKSGVNNIVTLIGGLHLMNATESRINNTISQLKQFAIGHIVPCHCTGEKAAELMAEAFQCTLGCAGMEIFLDYPDEKEEKQ